MATGLQLLADMSALDDKLWAMVSELCGFHVALMDDDLEVVLDGSWSELAHNLLALNGKLVEVSDDRFAVADDYDDDEQSVASDDSYQTAGMNDNERVALELCERDDQLMELSESPAVGME